MSRCSWKLLGVVAALVVAVGTGGCCGAVARLEPHVAAAYQQRAEDLRLGDATEYRVVVAPPFVLVGDLPAATLQQLADDVVVRATKQLQRNFFAYEPATIHTIWAFRNEYSYRIGVSRIFGGSPRSPYGYYAACDDALVVNLGLGTGTLIHEIVHPLMEANFPAAPTWLNEGLASLYEQTEYVNGSLRGRTNWRLPPLQRKLRRGRAPSLREVMTASRREFYASAKHGLNYGVARYLCYFLQERQQLHRYYHAFRRDHADDPDGIGTLEDIMGTTLERFEPQWHEFVLALEFSAT